MDNSAFLKIYANLPAKIREQIVVVIDDQPMTWNAAFFEISSNTELGKRIMNKLTEMEII